MTKDKNPFHAHIYYTAEEREKAISLQKIFQERLRRKDPVGLSYVGGLRDAPVGPHPIPQFEIHFLERDLESIKELILESGLRALLHPLTDDDLADHTTLADWIGEKLLLDLSVLDPPGKNQGKARFSKSDF